MEPLALLVGSDTFTYDDLLRRTGSSSSRYGVSQAMVYDDRGQMSSESTTYGGQTYTVSYDRDNRGRTSKVSYPSGTEVEYDYTDRGQLDTIKVNGNQIEDRGYSDLGQLASVDRPSIDEARTYDDRGQVTTIGNGSVGTATYGYDANGNKLSESWSVAMSAWNFTTQAGGNDGYDAEDRFLNFNQTGQSKTLSMTRSDIGNITNVNLNGTNAARGYSNAHELTSVGSSSQSYDTDGNQTSSVSGNSYQWDEGGMLQQVTTSTGMVVEYGYSADGKRIWKKVTDGGSSTETVYAHSGPNRIAEYAKGAAPTANGNEYAYAGGIDSLCMLIRAGLQYAITRNQQWSVAALVDSTGNVAERYTYDEFGKRTILEADGSTVRASSNFGMDFGYTSRSHEESGLMHFRARYYDPSTGEFISRDPLEYVDGMSLYRGYYVPGRIDPSGAKIEIKNVRQKLEGECKDRLFAHHTYNAGYIPGSRGYIVQKVSVACMYKEKCDSEWKRESYSYYEAFHVDPATGYIYGKRDGRPESIFAPKKFIMDWAQFENGPFVKVVYLQSALAKFYYARAHATGGDPEDPVSPPDSSVGQDIENGNKWKKGEQTFGKVCTTTGGFRTTEDEPTWWEQEDNSNPDGEPGFHNDHWARRTFAAGFNCECDCNGNPTGKGKSNAGNFPGLSGGN